MARVRPEMSETTKALRDVVKPLGAREERAAVDAARKRLGEELSDRYRFFPPDLRIEKPRRPGAAVQRAVAVLVIDYERRRTLEVLVDEKGKATRVVDLSGFQPAYHRDEVQEAREIAEREDRVKTACKVRGAFTSVFAPHGHGEPGTRLVGLRYAVIDSKGHGRLLVEAVVDLSDRRLVAFEDMAHEEGG